MKRDVLSRPNLGVDLNELANDEFPSVSAKVGCWGDRTVKELAPQVVTIAQDFTIVRRVFSSCYPPI